MDKRIFYKKLFLSLSFFLSLLGNAQKKITVKASVDKNKVHIGEQMHLELEANFPAGVAIHFFSIDSISHFLILNKAKVDSSRSDKIITLKQSFLLTSFDSGHWVIPSFYLAKKVKTDSLPVDVVFSDFDSSKPYHDIKEIMEVNPERENEWGWYVAAGAAILLVLLVVLFNKRKKTEEIAEEKIDPFKEAMNELKDLEKEKISHYEFYTRLVNVFRLYIFRKKGIHSLQKTTDDLIDQLYNINLNKEQFEKLSQSLRLSDAVKFAKYIPEQSEDKMVFENIKKSIHDIEHI